MPMPIAASPSIPINGTAVGLTPAVGDAVDTGNVVELTSDTFDGICPFAVVSFPAVGTGKDVTVGVDVIVGVETSVAASVGVGVAGILVGVGIDVGVGATVGVGVGMGVAVVSGANMITDVKVWVPVLASKAAEYPSPYGLFSAYILYWWGSPVTLTPANAYSPY